MNKYKKGDRVVLKNFSNVNFEVNTGIIDSSLTLVRNDAMMYWVKFISTTNKINPTKASHILVPEHKVSFDTAYYIDKELNDMSTDSKL